MDLTDRLRAAAEVVGVLARDHVIVAAGGYYSFVEAGRWEKVTARPFLRSPPTRPRERAEASLDATPGPAAARGTLGATSRPLPLLDAEGRRHAP